MPEQAIRRIENGDRAIEYVTPDAAMTRNTRFGADTVLEFLVLAGLVGLVFALLFWPTPKENEALLAQVVGALTVIATLVAKSLWERRGESGINAEASLVRAEATRDLAAKVSPGTGDAALGEQVEDGARKGAREGVEAGMDNAPPGDRVDRGRFPDIEPIVAPVTRPAADVDAETAALINADPAAVPAMDEEE